MNERSFTSPERNGTEEAILASALQAFGELGFHGSSIRQIAKGAGVSVANVYNYVQCKDDLLVQLLKRASDDQLRVTEEAVAAAGPDVRHQMAAAGAAYVRFDVGRPLECFVANSELRYLRDRDRARIVAARDNQQALFENLIEEGIDSGAFATPHPNEAVLAVLTMCSGVTLWYRPDGPLAADDIAERYARFALALLEARP